MRRQPVVMKGSGKSAPEEEQSKEAKSTTEAVEEPKKKEREKVMKGDSQTKASPPPRSILLNSHPSAVITLKGPGRHRPFFTQGTGLGSVT